MSVEEREGGVIGASSSSRSSTVRVTRKPLGITVPEQEYVAWRAQAEREGVSLTQWVRNRCNAGLPLQPAEAFRALEEFVAGSAGSEGVHPAHPSETSCPRKRFHDGTRCPVCGERD